MLILVGVTINVALNGGLFTKAEQATKQTEEKAILEEMLAMMELTDNGKIDYAKIKDKMILKYKGATYSYPNIIIPGKLGTYNYIVSETEIKIGNSDVPPQINSDFEKYIMGQDGNGRTIIGENGILSDSPLFMDDPLTENVDETETLKVELLEIGYNDNYTKMLVYVKYDDKAYKITLDLTLKSEKLELIYEPKGREGQKTAEGWTILYDNGETVEAVSPTAMGELRLGYSENITDSEIQLTEAIASYNSAITTINNYCKNELTGLPANSNVRSVGAETETTTDKYASDNLETWNSIGLNGDINFEQDFVRMAYYKVLATGTKYWMASRATYEHDDKVEFWVRYVREGGDVHEQFELWKADYLGNANGSNYTYAVRPIITIQN